MTIKEKKEIVNNGWQCGKWFARDAIESHMRPFFTLSIAIRADHHGGTRMIWSPSNVYLQFAYTCMMCQIFFPSWFLVLSFIQNTKGACIAFVAWLIITQAPRTPCHKELPKSVTLLGKKQQSPSIYAVTSSKRTLDHSFSKNVTFTFMLYKIYNIF